MQSKKFRFAVVGFGHIGKKHAIMVQGNSDSELVAVVDIDPEKLAVAKKDFGVKVFESVEAMLAENSTWMLSTFAPPMGCTPARPFGLWSKSAM